VDGFFAVLPPLLPLVLLLLLLVLLLLLIVVVVVDIGSSCPAPVDDRLSLEREFAFLAAGEFLSAI